MFVLIDRIHETFIQVLATSTRRNAGISGSVDHDPSDGVESEATLNFGDDDENMVSSSKGVTTQGHAVDAFSVSPNIDKHLRYRTRLFAAEYVNPHFLQSVSSALLLFYFKQN